MQPPVRLIAGLVLVALPLIEIALLIKSGQLLGFWPVILLVLATGFLGAWIIRTQGVATFRRISEAMAAGREPHDALANGALLLLSGGLLLLPGLMTDTAGLILLIPLFRQWIARTVFKPAPFGAAAGPRRPAGSPGSFEDAPRRHRRPRADDTVIEGEFERVDERTVDPAKSSRGGAAGDPVSRPPSE